MSELLIMLFGSRLWEPHGHCFLWDPPLLWLLVGANILIALAYFSIPFALVVLVRKRRDLVHKWVFWAFAVFILGCGLTHAVRVWTIWQPVYWLQGAVDAVTAGASVLTAAALWPLLPRILRLPSPAELRRINRELEEEIERRRRVEERLRLTEERFKTSLQHSPVVLFNQDTDLRYTWIYNPAPGFSEEAVLGKTDADLLPADTAKTLMAPKRAVLQTGEGRRLEVETIVEGSPAFYDLTIEPLHDASQEIAGITCASVDITDRKVAEMKLQASEDRFRNLLESAPDGIVVTDSDGRIQLVNSQAEKLFGYQRHELIGQPVEILVPAPRRPDHRHYRTQYTAHPETRPMGLDLDLYAQRKDGSQFPVEISLSPLDIPGDLAVISTIRDVSERRRIERDIQRLNHELQQRNQQLEAANAELESFSYSVSHDLRAPLRAMDGFSRILLEDYSGDIVPQAAHYLSRIRENAQQMGQLIDDLLAFSRLSRRSLKLQRVDPTPLVEQVIHDLAPLQQDRQVDLTLRELPACQADPALLKLVFLNLIENALKYTRSRETARIEVGSHTTDDEIVYYVRDNGVGFDPAYADRLFGVFQRLHRTEDYEGTGVGLATVQRIVHRHGGRVEAEGAVDEGATFRFTLRPASEETGDE